MKKKKKKKCRMLGESPDCRCSRHVKVHIHAVYDLRTYMNECTRDVIMEITKKMLQFKLMSETVNANVLFAETHKQTVSMTRRVQVFWEIGSMFLCCCHFTDKVKAILGIWWEMPGNKGENSTMPYISEWRFEVTADVFFFFLCKVQIHKVLFQTYDINEH